MSQRSSMLFSPSPKKKKRLQLRLSERRLLLIVGDSLAIACSVLIALGIWSVVGQLNFVDLLFEQVGWFFAMTTLWFLVAGANDFYELSLAAKRWQSLQRLTMITFQMLIAYLIIFFLSEPASLPRLFIFYYGVASFGLVALWRLLNPALIGWTASPLRALVVGTDWTAETLIQTLQDEAPQAYKLVGLVAQETEPAAQDILGVPVLGTGKDILQIVLSEDVREIIVTSTHELPGETFQGVMDAYERGVAIVPMPIVYERITERVPVEHVGSHWTVVLPVQGHSVFNPYPFLSRLMDVMLSLIGLVFFVLLLPILALAIYLDSPGAIFYVQSRVGWNGRVFRIIKFRTMIPDAEKVTGPVFAGENDPRVTRMGRFMRKTRLDELPQLINVLRGDMSLVGPRPERPEHVQRLQQKIPFYRTRHIIRPGVTGWAQVRYKYGANDEDALMKLQYDLYYIRHQSIALDTGILIRTIGKALKMEGQ